MPDALLGRCLRLMPLDQVMAHVGRICRHDRYQGSTGLERAAEDVAESAATAGLADVRIDRHPADGTARWWTWQAPISWTPTRAVLEAYEGPELVLRVDHAEQPFSIAAHSAATPPGGRVARLARTGDPARPGTFVVVDRSDPGAARPHALAAAGVVGFVSDLPWKGDPQTPHPGRIELPQGSGLTAFSVTPPQLARLATAADRGGRVRLVVEVDRSASMPVVSGVLPGTHPDEEEVWLTAHLCHPRPGANDNASGVAALLGVAAALSTGRRTGTLPASRASVRFFWGPEYLGQAAVLHECLGPQPRWCLPRAVVNLDMVGEDQARCRSPFVVERPAELAAPSLLTPLAEYYVDQVFRATAARPGTWRSSPFMGFSDHALFADPVIARPAVQFCHPADLFNHSAGDAFDKVSEVEMLRSAAAAAALVQTLASGGPGRHDLRGIVSHWCQSELARVRAVAASARDPAWARSRTARAESDTAMLMAMAESGTAPPPHRSAPPSDGPPVTAAWSGPVNIRAMMADLSGRTCDEVADLVAADKVRLALLLQFAIRADGRRTRADIVRDTSLALDREIDPAVARRLFDALLESRWLREAAA